MLSREQVVEKFNEILKDKEKALTMENAIYNQTQIIMGHVYDETLMDFQIFYLEKARSLYDNLKKKSYFNTTEQREKKIKPEDYAKMDIKNLRHKTLWKTIKQNQEILDKNLMDLKPTSETDQFLCKKCKNRKTTFYTMQIRSADEAETSFITCLVCNYSWREG